MKNKSSDVIAAGNTDAPGLLLTKHEGGSFVSEDMGSKIVNSKIAL